MKKEYDVVIVGAGLAGLYAALQFENNTSVLMISKRELILSNSALAQGGVAAVLDERNDDHRLHIADTLIAGSYENNLSALRLMVTEGSNDVKHLLELGVPFDKDENGDPVMTLEGGHSRKRIVHYKDSTGYQIVDTLIKEVKKKSNVDIIENACLFEINKAKGGFHLSILKNGQATVTATRYVIMATGGIGRVYKYTTNSKIATGDGIMLAYYLGAEIKDLHYIQFHPTASVFADREQFLISEAVRGEGAYLRNCDGERFMSRYDERMELAPRDVVSRSIILESRRTGSDEFYLDITHKDPDFIKNRFPMIYSRCLEAGVDITNGWIPIFPCQHYLMGGIKVDTDGQTTVDKLYAAGECTNTGVHGKNRLASNSLLEAMVFGRRSAESIKKRLANDYQPIEEVGEPPEIDGAPMLSGLRTEIREIMQRSYFVIPDKGAVREGLARIVEIKDRLDRKHYKITEDYLEAKSLATVAYIILKNCGV